MSRFLAKLRELLRLRVRDGDLSEDDFNTAVRQAAGHVGGSVRWEQARASKEFVYQNLSDLPDAVKKLPEKAQKVWLAAFNSAFKTAPSEGRAAAIAWAAANKIAGSEDLDADIFVKSLEESTMNPFRLLAELSFAEDGKTGQVQIFPPVGKYSHPRYGELAITPEFLKTVKGNFDSKVYQQELPLTIDLEHQSALSGAAGWIKDVEIRGDKGMWATVEFNDRGKSLVGADAYRYFSPEFYDTWTDPASSKKYKSMLIGGALTNRPFFKGMSPVAMMSEDSFYFMEAAEAQGDMAGKMESMMAMMQKCMDMMGDMKGDMPEGMADDMAGLLDRMKKKMPKGDHQMVEKTEDGESYPAAAFLYTPEMDKPSTWQLRIWESPEAKVTKPQLGRAAAAFSPGGFRGNKVEIPAEDKASVLSKLRGLYAKMGAKPDELPAYIRASLTEAGLSEAEASAVLVEMSLESISGGDRMTEEEARQFAEQGASLKALTERLDKAEEARKTAEEAATKAAERVTNLERVAQRKTFSEFVRTNRLAFQGEVDKVVDRLEVLSAKLSEEEFTEYLEERKVMHARMKESDLFRPIGQPGGTGDTSAMGEIDAAVRKAMAEDPKLTDADALVKVGRENPSLYARYDREQQRRIKRGEED